MALKRKIEQDIDGTGTDESPGIFRSAPIVDRSSTFVGLFSPVLKPKELQALAELADASHRILGWRRESNQQSINKAARYVTGFDEDGERFGGKHVVKALEVTKVTGAIVVARWYGGVNLGPVRFAHIEACALEAIQRWQDDQTEASSKRMKLEEHVRLAQTLRERDNSIRVLRALAHEKEANIPQTNPKVKADDDTRPISTTEQSSSDAPAKQSPNYDKLPLASLKALEKARDATLTFLLKRIDEAEARLKTSSRLPEPP